MNAVHKQRRAHWFFPHKLKPLAKLYEMWIYLVHNSSIPAQCEIGEGTSFGYKGIGVVIHKCEKIGKNCVIAQGGTIGGRSGHYEVPVIGDNCHIGAAAKVLGPIVIGDNVTIGANAVMIKDAPSGPVWGGACEMPKVGTEEGCRMSVLFTSAIDFNSNSSLGISAKVMSQARASEEAGHVYISKDYGLETRIERPSSGEVVACHVRKTAGDRRSKYAFLSDWSLANGVEAVVIRFDHLDSVFCSFSKRLRSHGVVLAVEFPTFPFELERDARHKRLLESHKYLSYVAHRTYAWLESLRAKHAPRYFDYAITYLDDDTIWGVPNITYDNGIDLGAIPLRKVGAPCEVVRLLAVAKFSPHHGVDRLIRGLAEYKGDRPVRLTLVGVGAENPSLEKLVSELKLGDSVVFAGAATGSKLDAFFDDADVAVGSLGLHRIGISLGSTMKSREYCARGIPFIYSFPEKGFNGDEEFTLLLPSNDDPIPIDKVIAFANRVAADPETDSKMRVFAEEQFDWKAQMDKVLKVLEAEVADKRGKKG